MCCTQWQEGQRDVGKMLDSATRLHNITPHSAIGTSPYEALFGKPPVLDALQEVTPSVTEEERRENHNMRLRERMTEVMLRERPLEKDSPNDLKQGDLVVVLNDPGSAASSLNGPETPRWFASRWSLPMKIERTQVEVEQYGQPGSTFKVHKETVRKFKKSEDPELESLTREYLERMGDEPEEPVEEKSTYRRLRIYIDPETREGLEHFLGISAVPY
ncbi:hypothetical protein GNI_102980 [Gregarina niphandrodes]|uniref:Integrase catalytic domain-containing protein n=1 Tax=Gregarina niphandrodes TaxID=110365 RepID=A0A023B4C3_GRENI|nr:hypothetical protein GNI_102980 [Gregarina niphandrodes]EZG56551.1 hypothetical protein GNI_102980 [Gregarina niphandrodes]|eukprot:XP_011131233.1 hypothetical protein GNI_102980 [Gregarina niphandrodes]